MRSRFVMNNSLRILKITIFQVSCLVALVKDHLGVEELPEPIITEGKFPPVLKIRGLLHRDGNKRKSAAAD